MPDNAPRAESGALTRVARQAQRWAAGDAAAGALDTAAWTTQEWLHFLRSLPPRMTAEQMGELDRTFGFTAVGNAEVAHQWLLAAIRNRYAPAAGRIESYLIGIGRRKLITRSTKRSSRRRRGARGPGRFTNTPGPATIR